VKELGKYIPIHIYGSCGGTECLLSRKDSSASQLCHPSLAQNRYHYKFYLSFENSLCTDYVTEKFFSILDTSMIPIVYGGADYKAMFPPYSYIDVMDFPSVQALAKYLTQLLQHPKQYAKYFQWRSEYYLLNDPWLPGYCEICQKLLIRQAKQMKRGEEELEDFSYANVYNWWIYGVDSETEEKKKGFKDIKLCWDEDRVNQFIMRFTGNSSK
jgi:alpha-1,3-fucosyltransferase